MTQPEPTTPTQFERIFTAAMSSMLSNPSKNGGVADLCEQAKRITQEAIKQIKEIEGA